MRWGELASLPFVEYESVTVNVVDSLLPVVEGVNVTPIKQLAPPGTVIATVDFCGTGHVLSAVNLKSAFAGAAIGWTVKGIVATLWTWNTFSGVVVLMISLPKSNVLTCSANPNSLVVIMTGPGIPVPDMLKTS
jgi:hypothetical protein